MIRGMTLVTTSFAALLLSATSARPASATPGAAGRPIAAEHDTRGRRGANTPGTAAVISLSVVPTADRAEMIIGVDGPVDVQNFALSNPDKIVIDISGATLGIPAAESYDRVTRAGIINVRYSQYRKNVVRVVLTLESARPYAVVRGKHEVRVSVEGRSSRLVAWHVGYDMPANTVADRPAKVEVTESRSPTPKVSEPRREPTLSNSRFASMQQRSQQPRITIAWRTPTYTTSSPLSPPSPGARSFPRRK